MSRRMTLPKIGVNMTEAVISKWLVKPGDVIKEGDPVIEAETDKSTQEIYATEGGKVAELLAEEGETVQCHADIIVLIDEGEEYVKEEKAETAKPEKEAAAAPEEKAAEPPKNVSAPVKVQGDRVRISPLARKIAKENGIDINVLAGFYPNKRIVKNDVNEYISRNASAPRAVKADETVAMSNVRKIIARKMTESSRDIPTVPLVTSINAARLIELREIYKDKGIKVSYDAIIAKAAGKALAEHPNINVSYAGDNMIVHSSCNVGVAVDTDKGLFVPVVRDAAARSLSEIGADLSEKVGKAKEGRLSPDDSGGASMTITNLGMFGVEEFTPIINPPESCILGIGGFKNELVPDDEDDIVSIPTMKLTLVFDHRVVDGAPAARFLKTIAEYLETPELMI